MNALPCTIYVSFTGALLALAVGGRSPTLARIVALASAVTAWAIALYAAVHFVPDAGGAVTLVDAPWIPQMGIRYHLAADGISLTLVVLTGLAATA